MKMSDQNFFETKVYDLQFSSPEIYERYIMKAADYLNREEVVAIPTETVYGLAARVDSECALKKIYQVKGRPSDNPLIVHLASSDDLPKYVAMEKLSQNTLCLLDLLLKHYTPGPLTMILPKAAWVSKTVSAGLETIALRIPESKYARDLIKAVGIGLAAPSANRSGKPSPCTAQDVYEDLNHLVPCILDGGASNFGLESTILDLSTQPVRILRPGAITEEMISSLLDSYNLGYLENKVMPYFLPNLSQESRPIAPGMKYRHYAPKARVHILSSESFQESFKSLDARIHQNQHSDLKLALFCSDDFREGLKQFLENKYQKSIELEALFLSCFSYGTQQNYQLASASLFTVFRQFDRLGATDIYVTDLPDKEMGTAFMNRLIKAASKNS